MQSPIDLAPEGHGHPAQVVGCGIQFLLKPKSHVGDGKGCLPAVLDRDFLLDVIPVWRHDKPVGHPHRSLFQEPGNQKPIALALDGDVVQPPRMRAIHENK